MLKNYLVEWEEDTSVTPVQVQPSRRSPPMEAIERCHLERELRYGNASFVPPGTTVRWSSRVHLVNKPREKPALGQGGKGRLVNDFRCPNRATRRKASTMTDAWEMLRSAARAMLLSLLDAYSGFSHLRMGLTAKALTVINTVLGLGEDWGSPGHIGRWNLLVAGGVAGNPGGGEGKEGAEETGNLRDGRRHSTLMRLRKNLTMDGNITRNALLHGNGHSCLNSLRLPAGRRRRRRGSGPAGPAPNLRRLHIQRGQWRNPSSGGQGRRPHESPGGLLLRTRMRRTPSLGGRCGGGRSQSGCGGLARRTGHGLGGLLLLLNVLLLLLLNHGGCCTGAAPGLGCSQHL